MLPIAFVVLFLVAVGKSEPIVRGTAVTTVEFPFLVHLKITFTENDLKTKRVKSTIAGCGGTIVGEKTILTAAHCLQSLTPPHVAVHAGYVYFWDILAPEHSNSREMVDYKIHPDYEDHDIDLALIYLKKELALQPGKVEVASFTVAKFGYDVEIVGWGLMENNQHTDVLRKATLKVVRQTDCNERYRYHNNFLCIMDPRKVRTLCDGDSGGPIIYDNKVVGVLFASDNEIVKESDGKETLMCSPRRPGIGVNIARFMGWILKNRQ